MGNSSDRAQILSTVHKGRIDQEKAVNKLGLNLMDSSGDEAPS